jgi:AcrR family transcriptional regulator
VNPATATRLSASERREAILDAAMVEFAERGYHGTSTEQIAKRAGISQPYLFRLFGTKKELFKAASARCMLKTLETFQSAAEGKRGEEALKAMGEAYMTEFLPDRARLGMQLQTYAASDDPEIREVVRNGMGDLVSYVERVSGVPTEEVANFIAKGMFLNMIAALDLDQRPAAWSQPLIDALMAKHGS